MANGGAAGLKGWLGIVGSAYGSNPGVCGGCWRVGGAVVAGGGGSAGAAGAVAAGGVTGVPGVTGGGAVVPEGN